LKKYFMKNNRRDFLKLAGLTGLGFKGINLIPAYADKSELQSASAFKPQTTSPLIQLNRFPRMVHEYFVERVTEVEQAAITRRSELKTSKDAETYILEVREKIQKCFGPWPEKTPLKARITGIIKRDAYNIEKVIFESRPGFPVTANLYIPSGRKFPLPGVIGSCGHSAPGKSTPYNQSFAQGLARHGYIVLIFDPIGQGERLQYINNDLKSSRGAGVQEHLYAGNQMVLAGESFSSWRTWDAIRAIDYLLTRSEIDPKHLGMTGASGGGTMTTWVCGADPRLTMAAPCCFVTTFRRNLENELVADPEQYPPHALALGLDHSDFIAAMAPKPVILLGEEKDYFDARGLEESFARLKNLYRLLGSEQNIQLFIGPNEHSYSPVGREAMYAWFNSVTKISDLKTEPSLTLENEDTLWCTPHGQVGEAKPNTVFSFTGKKSSELRKKRGSLNGDQLKQAVINALKLPPFNAIPDFRILRPVANRLYPKKFTGTYMVETEANIFALVYRLDDNQLLSRPPKGLKRALLYVSHLSADNELRQETFIREIINNEPDSAVFACDVRGIGESQPNTCGNNFLEPYGNDYFYAGHSIMLDYPYAGQKTYDVLRVISWLKSYGHEEIHLAGKGWGAIPAIFAALLSDAVSQVTLKNALTSYSDIAENEEYNWPLSPLLPGVLKTFDLPDCYRALESKKLSQIEPWNALAGKK
jgi:dienelactone hydrolase